MKKVLSFIVSCVFVFSAIGCNVEDKTVQEKHKQICEHYAHLNESINDNYRTAWELIREKREKTVRLVLADRPIELVDAFRQYVKQRNSIGHHIDEVVLVNLKREDKKFEKVLDKETGIAKEKEPKASAEILKLLDQQKHDLFEINKTLECE